MSDEIERFKLSLADVVMQTQEQAQEIERLRAALDKAQMDFANERYNAFQLRAALRDISLMDKRHEHDLFSATQVARAALKESSDE